MRSSEIAYRPELDGLRAIAVILVVLYHAGFDLFAGGFIGVDIFFVISGFLISSIIYKSLNENSFSMITFYERRIYRILPAMYVVCAACVPFAFLTMLPDYLENFGQSLFATVFSANNILLWLTSGYFQLENEFKPLLHTWSLGVEEQFYVIFPVLFLFLMRFQRHVMLLAILIISLCSLILADVLFSYDRLASFFLLPARAFELLMGVVAMLMVYAYPKTVQGFLTSAIWRELLGLVGLALVVLPAFFIDANTRIPGYLTLIPVLGVFIIIIYVDQRCIAGRLLSSRPLVFVGLISYSLYLWHQPLFAYWRLINLEPPKYIDFIIIIFVALVFSFFTWRYVEIPFLKREPVYRFQRLAVLGLFTILLASTGFVLHSTGGAPTMVLRSDPVLAAAGRDVNALYNQRPFEFADRDFSADNRSKLLVFGNSEARDVINTAIEAGLTTRVEISYSELFPECLVTAGALTDELKKRIAKADAIVFGSGVRDLECWQRGADRELLRLGAKSLIVVGTKNFGWNMNAVLRLPAETRASYSAKVLPEVLERNRSVAAVTGDRFIDLLGLIETSPGRVPVVDEAGYLISQDRLHLTPAGARFLGKFLFRDERVRSALKLDGN